MLHETKRMNTSSSTWTGIRLALFLSVASLSACQPRPVEKVVIPDTHDLRPAIVCNEKGECVKDDGRVTIDLGYLRELIDLLDVCRKQRI